MKKFVSFGALLLILSLAFISCKKQREHEGETKYQTIEIVLDMNKSYQYSFGTPSSELTITKQSDNFLVSQLDEANETVLFNYMPKTNFVGTDEIQVTLGEDEHEKHEHGGHHKPKNPIMHLLGGGHKHHDCGKHEDDKTIYIFKFTVNSVATVVTTEHTTVNKN